MARAHPRPSAAQGPAQDRIVRRLSASLKGASSTRASGMCDQVPEHQGEQEDEDFGRAAGAPAALDERAGQPAPPAASPASATTVSAIGTAESASRPGWRASSHSPAK